MGQPLQRILEEFPIEVPHGALSAVRRLRPQPNAPPPTEQPINQLEEAYARGYDEGLNVHRVAMQVQIDAAQDEYQQSLKLAISRFSDRVADELTDKLHTKLNALQATIADEIAAALVPVLSYALQESSIRELVAGLRTLTSDSETVTVELCGPKDLIEAVWQSYCETETYVLANGPVVKFVVDETQEVRATVNDAVIEVRLKDWISKLMDAVR